MNVDWIFSNQKKFLLREKPEMVFFPLQGYAYLCVRVSRQSNTLTLAVLVLT